MGEEVLFSKDQMDASSDDENIWDDSVLIKAYDKAINSTKKKIECQLANKDLDSLPSGSDTTKVKNQRPTNLKNEYPSKKRWKVGMPCRAVFSEDGLEYEAVIKSIRPDRGTCRVVYVGYNNEEEVSIDLLKCSNGKLTRIVQQYEAENVNSSSYSEQDNQQPDSNQPNEHQTVIPPPPPPHIMAHFPKDEEDAFSAMMMSWYMSGYHTGYYQALSRVKCSHPQCTANLLSSN